MADTNKADNVDDSGSGFNDSTDFEFEVKKRCVWCNKFAVLLEKQKHCGECDAKAFRVCRRCRLPYDDAKYFAKDINRCNSCQLKYLKEKEKREAKRQLRAENKASSGEEDNAPAPRKKIKLNKKPNVKAVSNFSETSGSVNVDSHSSQQKLLSSTERPSTPFPTGFRLKWITERVYVIDDQEQQQG